VASYLNTAEEVISQKINFFTIAKNCFSFLVGLGVILQVLAFFLTDDKERGRKNKLEQSTKSEN